jgi:hypothetical protein
MGLHVIVFFFCLRFLTSVFLALQCNYYSFNKPPLNSKGLYNILKGMKNYLEGRKKLIVAASRMMCLWQLRYWHIMKFPLNISFMKDLIFSSKSLTSQKTAVKV